jgi:hypothetical protein
LLIVRQTNYAGFGKTIPASMETTADSSIEQTKGIMIVEDNLPHAGTKKVVGNHSAPLDIMKKQIPIFYATDPDGNRELKEVKCKKTQQSKEAQKPKKSETKQK